MEVFLSAADLVLKGLLSLSLEHAFYMFLHIWGNLTLLLKLDIGNESFSRTEVNSVQISEIQLQDFLSALYLQHFLPLFTLRPNVWLSSELAWTLPWWMFFTERNCSAEFITFLKDISILPLEKKKTAQESWRSKISLITSEGHITDFLDLKEVAAVN